MNETEGKAPARAGESERPIPPLIHIGYHKTASTWLQRLLFSRTDCGLKRIKLDRPFHNLHPLHFSPESYRDHYRARLAEVDKDLVPVISLERLSGHPHSGGIDSKDIADRLKSVFPDARIVMVIREQRSAILSSWYQFVKKGGTSSLKNYLRPRPDGHVPLFHPDHFCYDGLIAYYQSLFGAQRVKVLTFEQFRAEPHEFLAELAGFGGFKAPENPPLGRKSNKAAPPVKVLLRSRFNLLIRRDTVNRCSPYASWLGATVLLPVINLAGKLASNSVNAAYRRRWQRRVAREFEGYFAQSNRKTEALTGLDLGSLGYDVAAETPTEEGADEPQDRGYFSPRHQHGQLSRQRAHQ